MRGPRATARNTHGTVGAGTAHTDTQPDTMAAEAAAAATVTAATAEADGTEHLAAHLRKSSIGAVGDTAEADTATKPSRIEPLEDTEDDDEEGKQQEEEDDDEIDVAALKRKKVPLEPGQ